MTNIALRNVALVCLAVIALRATTAQAADVKKFRSCTSAYVSASNSPLTVLYAGAGLYQSYRQRIFNTRFTWKQPLGVALPASTKDVQNLVLCANKASVRFVTRNGGHSYEGLSSVDNGLVIDLSNMLRIKVNTRAKAAVIAAGQRLGPVYKYLYEKARALIPAGTGVGVGVSGLTLGGGIGSNSRKLGLAIDYVLSAVVVLPDGRAVTASGKSYPDLFFAIRGGTGNYGIVTSWTFKIAPVPAKVTILEVVWPSSSFKAVMAAIAKWRAWSLPDNYSKIVWTYGYSSVSLSIDYWGPKKHMEALLRAKGTPFAVKGYQLSYLQELSYVGFLLKYTNYYNDPNWNLNSLNYNSVVKREFGPDAPAQSKANSFKGSSVILNTDLTQAAAAALDRVKSANRKGWIQGGALRGRMAAISNSATAYPHRTAKWYLQHYTSVQSGNDVGWIDDVKAAMRPWSTGYEYVNYIDCGSKDPWTTFFAGNAAKLKAIKKKYDPKNRINALC